MERPAPRVCVINLGCRVNRVESDWMETSFVQAGSSLCAQDEADIVAINTCAVTGEAQAKTRKAVRHAAGLPRRPLVAVTGCVANLFPAELEAIGENVRVFPAKLALVEDALGEWGRLQASAAGEGEDASLFKQSSLLRSCGTRDKSSSPSQQDSLQYMHQHDFTPASHAVFRARRGVKIQDGCDNHCTYCIVWRARGKSLSTPYSLIESQVRQVLAEGALEVDLTGINLGRYSCADNGGEALDLAGLIGRLAPIMREHGALLRAGSIEPPEVGEGLVAAYAANADVVAPFFHLPLQAGSDGVLHRMGRRYTAEQFLEKVSLIREALPAAAISTDIIVGFPGETEEDFQETLALAQKASFSKIHAFRFSARPDTPAAGMPDQVSPEVIRGRSERLRVLSDRLRYEDAARRVGTVEPVLIEHVDADGAAHGTTASHHEVLLIAGAHRFDGAALTLLEMCGVGSDGTLLGRVPSEVRA